MAGSGSKGQKADRAQQALAAVEEDAAAVAEPVAEPVAEAVAERVAEPVAAEASEGPEAPSMVDAEPEASAGRAKVAGAALGEQVLYRLREGRGAGEERPALVVRVAEDGLVNLAVFTDFANDGLNCPHWEVSVGEGAGAGEYQRCGCGKA